MRSFASLSLFCLLASPALGCSGRKAAVGREAAAAAPANPAPLPGVDASGLSESDQAALGRLLKRFASACGKGHSLEVSLRTDPGCKRSVFAARYVVRLFKAHLLESEVEEQYEKRFGAHPKLSFDLKQSPLRGQPHAPVVFVEFSDFQCPHCKRIQPVLERVLEEFSGQVRLYFKNYPITRAHPDSATAAAGALAAGRQGKFWPFHDRLFGGDQEHAAMSDLEKIAKDLKLDLKKWKADLDASKEQVARDRAEGERVEISSTPSLFINGRRYSGPLTYEELKDWVEEELNR